MGGNTWGLELTFPAESFVNVRVRVCTCVWFTGCPRQGAICHPDHMLQKALPTVTRCSKYLHGTWCTVVHVCVWGSETLSSRNSCFYILGYKMSSFQYLIIFCPSYAWIWIGLILACMCVCIWQHVWVSVALWVAVPHRWTMETKKLRKTQSLQYGNTMNTTADICIFVYVNELAR